MTATTTKLFTAVTFIAALLTVGCDYGPTMDSQVAILGDACNPAEIAGVLDLETNVIDHTDAEFGQYEIDPIVINPSGVTWEQMDLILDELCVDVRRPDALDTPPLPGRDYRADALEILADAAPATGEMHDDNVMKSGRGGFEKPHGLDLDNRTRPDSGFDPKPTRDIDGQVLEPGKPQVAELDTAEPTTQCYEPHHPLSGDFCMLCCTGPDCYMTCVTSDAE